MIARVRTPEYSEEAEYLKKQLGLAMIINPDLLAAQGDRAESVYADGAVGERLLREDRRTWCVSSFPREMC